MAEEICQKEINLSNGCYHNVLVEICLPNMLVVSLKSGNKTFRGALMDMEKENLNYGINLSRSSIIDSFRSVTVPGNKCVTVRPEAPESLSNKTASAFSPLHNRFSYSLDSEAVDPSLKTAAGTQSTQSFSARPLINKSVNRMRLRARQVVCSNCKKGIHDNKKGASSQKNKVKSSEIKTRSDSSIVKRSQANSARNEVKLVLPSSRSTTPSKGFDDIYGESKKPKHTLDSKGNDENVRKKQRLATNETNEVVNKKLSSKHLQTVVKSSPTIKISFASPKGIGTVLIPPRPSTPNVLDSDNIKDKETRYESDSNQSTERTSKRQKSKKSSKRDKHGKHKSKKKEKWSVIKSPSPEPSPSSQQTSSPGAKSLVGYRFVPRKSPLQAKQISPEDLKCKVVLEKLGTGQISAKTVRNSERAKSEPTSVVQKQSEQTSDQNQESVVSTIGPVESNVTDTQDSQKENTPVQKHCDYKQYFEDISDNDSDALQVDLGDDDFDETSSRAPGSPLNESLNLINAEKPSSENHPLKIHIQSRTITKCELEDGRLLRVGDVVWGKIVGFPWWPGKISALLESFKDSDTVISRTAHVIWFGSPTMSIMNCSDLYPFLDFYKEKFTKKRKGAYKIAIKQANLVAQTLQTSFKVIDNLGNTVLDGGEIDESETELPRDENSLNTHKEDAIPGECSVDRFSYISSCDSSQDSVLPPELNNEKCVESVSQVPNTLARTSNSFVDSKVEKSDDFVTDIDPSATEEFSTVDQSELDFVSDSKQSNFLDDIIDQGLISDLPPDLSDSLGPLDQSPLAGTPQFSTQSSESFFDLEMSRPQLQYVSNTNDSSTYSSNSLYSNTLVSTPQQSHFMQSQLHNINKTAISTDIYSDQVRQCNNQKFSYENSLVSNNGDSFRNSLHSTKLSDIEANSDIEDGEILDSSPEGS